MNDLIAELDERGWEYDFDGYVLHVIYRNEEIHFDGRRS